MCGNVPLPEYVYEIDHHENEIIPGINVDAMVCDVVLYVLDEYFTLIYGRYYLSILHQIVHFSERVHAGILDRLRKGQIEYCAGQDFGKFPRCRKEIPAADVELIVKIISRRDDRAVGFEAYDIVVAYGHLDDVCPISQI